MYETGKYFPLNILKSICCFEWHLLLLGVFVLIHIYLWTVFSRIIFLGSHMKGKDKESNLNFPNHKAMHLSYYPAWVVV